MLFRSALVKLLAGYGLFLLSDLMVSELLKNSSFVLAAVLLMLLCGYGIWQGIEGRARVYEILIIRYICAYKGHQIWNAKTL